MFEKLQSLLNDSSFQSNVIHRTKKFNPNDKILIQGEMHPCIYLIKSGKVRIVVSGDLEEKKMLRPGVNELGQDDIFGEFGIFDDSPASADVIAITKTELIEIDIASFKKYLQDNPKIGYEIFLEMLKILVQRLRHADKTIVNLFAWGIKAHQIDKHLE